MLSWGAWSSGCSCTAYFQAFISTAAGQPLIIQQQFLYFAWAISKYYARCPCCFWLISGFWVASAHCWVILNFSSTNTPSPSPQGCSQPLRCPASTCAWDCPDPDAQPWTRPCFTSSGKSPQVCYTRVCVWGKIVLSQLLERSICSSKDGALHWSGCVYTIGFVDSINSIEKIRANTITNQGTLAWEHKVSLKALIKDRILKRVVGKGQAINPYVINAKWVFCNWTSSGRDIHQPKNRAWPIFHPTL